MNEFAQWWEVAKLGGAGAAFVLGIVAWKLWAAYGEEVRYQRDRDSKTLAVLADMMKNDEIERISHGHEKSEILAAIADLKRTIMEHDRR